MATTVCATGGVHTLRVARTFSMHFSLARRTDTNTHGSRFLQCACQKSPSRPLHSHVSSTILAVPARSLRHLVPVCTFLAELFPIRKRGSSALPHERRGVWLPGRSHGVHLLFRWNIVDNCTSSWQTHRTHAFGLMLTCMTQENHGSCVRQNSPLEAFVAVR